MNPIIGKCFWEHSPNTWMDFVKSLRKIKALTDSDSRAAIGIKVSKRKDGSFTVRHNRNTKTATNVEVAALEKEFDFEATELWTALTARGWVITNESGEILNATAKRTRAPRRPKATQGNANHLDTVGRMQEGADQLFFTRADPDLLEESPVLTSDEPKEG